MNINLNPMSFRLPVVLIGWLLIVAALLKSVETATNPAQDRFLSVSGSLGSAIVIGTEMLLGSWLVCGFYPTAGRVAAIGLFAFFAVVNSLQLRSGVPSCRCFGPIQISPGVTLVLDLVALVALTIFSPARSHGATAHSHPLRFAVACVACLAATAGPLAVRYSRAGSEEILIAEPDTWSSARFPMLEDIDVAEDLEEGNWLLVLYLPQCEVCQRVIKQCEERAHSEGSWLALIVVQPDSSSRDEPYRSNHGVVHGRLRQGRSWIVRVPVCLRLRDGIVWEFE
jgi:hypothetical protein